MVPASSAGTVGPCLPPTLAHRRGSGKRSRPANAKALHVASVLSVPDSVGASSPPRPTLMDGIKCRPLERVRETAEDPGVFVTLTAPEGASLEVFSSGRVVLRDIDGGSVAEASVHLPSSCRHGLLHPAIVRQDVVDGRLDGVTLRWGTPSEPEAELNVDTASGANWCKGLSHGFQLEFRVNQAACSRAEVAIQLAPSGHWFGGGHFIRQMWPLNTAALEVGPWYGFDNGPNGVNNLLGSHFLTSKGLLVTMDLDSPFLHVGMNAPMPKGVLDLDEGWMPRKWGVGIQNAARELLPLTRDNGRVARAGQDGCLRIQSRHSYAGTSVEHPLRHWTVDKSSISSCSEDDCVMGSMSRSSMLSVRVALSSTANAAEACKMALSTLSPPKQIPSIDVLRAPIWTTWARYKTNVTQAKVLRYAQEIVERNLPRSVLEVDDRWQVLYGDLTFDPQKFPDPVAMVEQLHDMGFKVTCWVHPFVEQRSAAYSEGAPLGYFVGSGSDASRRNARSGWLGWLARFGAAEAVTPSPSAAADPAHKGTPGFFDWWNTPRVVALDVTNPEAVDWFVGRLKALQAATGLDGFKFDAGEPCFLPPEPRTHLPLQTPSDYTRLYIERVAGQFAGSVSEVRTGHQTQSTAVMCRMGDRFSTWSSANGLRSLIPTLLTSGLLGYPFCLPDMIGGNAYFGSKPDAELLVRWAQVNALMPAVQFSIAPWNLNNRDAERLVAAALEVRAKLEHVLLELAEEAAHTLMPICRPLWMLAPADDQTYAISDQFALGAHVIVAPVVHRGARQRDVYLTDGRWRSLSDPGSILEGGRWLRGLPAPLDCLPVFVRDGTPGIVL